jgi:RNA polymerase sigma-70 factor (ECF subfamily)
VDPAPPDPTPDAAFDLLIQQAATGDAQALRSLALQYEPRVRTVAHMLLGRALRPYLDSVDLVQSVHESLLVGLQAGKFEFASQQKMVALAVLMVRRKVAGHWRKQQRQHRMSLVGHADASDLADLVTSAATPEPAPDVALQYREQLEQLCQQLSEADRQLVSLRLEGFDTAEIARQLQVSEVAARVRLTRLRQRLQATGAMADWL